jgi:hypothetical protein
MTTQTIDRGNRFEGIETLMVADESDHVQWIRLADIDRFGADEPHVPFMGRCGTCDERHQWRRVRVAV